MENGSMNQIPELTNKLEPNVIGKETTQSLFRLVFNSMASVVAKTYGPFGENTAYQEGNRILTTKDGWTVEQSILFPQSIIASVIRKMIVDVSTAINLKAGDGTTTGLLAANEINEGLLEYRKATNIHSKFLEAALKTVVEKICLELNKSAIKITDENLEDIIYQVACVSLDWDLELAGFIRDIYKTTGNSIIRVQNSGTENSFVEYQNGYYIPAKLISEFKVNNVGEKKYSSDRVALLTFSYGINASMFEPLLTAAVFINQKLGRELVVLAPNFDKGFRDAYVNYCQAMIKRKMNIPPLVMARYNAEFNIEREMMVDFGFLTGGIIISKENTEVEEFMHEFVDITKKPVPNRNEYKHQKDYEKAIDDYKQMMITAGNEFLEKMTENYLGICDSITITDKSLVASGFGDIEESEELVKRRERIQAEIDKAIKDFSAKSMITDEIRLKSIRLGKLKLKMGIINVGGFGESQLKAKRDALDDAIRACEKAFFNGIVPGAGIGIITAIDNVTTEMSNGKSSENQLILDILKIFRESFLSTIRIMFKNRYPDGTTDFPWTIGKEIFDDDPAFEDITMIHIDDIIRKSIALKKPWNLIENKFDDGIIHPVTVETEVVKGVLNLILNTITINQLVYNSYDDARKELEGFIRVKD